MDPKTVVCINWKNGHCERGNRCKFAHDHNAGRKVEKIDVYTDTRDDKPKDEDTMENWTEEKLREVIAKKMGENGGQEEGPSTSKGKNTQERYDIVCKYFIEAIENGKVSSRISTGGNASAIARPRPSPITSSGKAGEKM